MIAAVLFIALTDSLQLLCDLRGSWNNALGVVSVGGTGCSNPDKGNNFLLPEMSGPVLRSIQPATQSVRDSLLRLKRQDMEVNRSPSSRTEVTNEWSYTSAALYVSVARTGTNFI